MEPKAKQTLKTNMSPENQWLTKGDVFDFQSDPRAFWGVLFDSRISLK